MASSSASLSSYKSNNDMDDDSEKLDMETYNGIMDEDLDEEPV